MFYQRLRGGGRSVHTRASARFADLPIDSPRVGCGWMVLPMSVSSQPISMAKVVSPFHRSPVARMRADDGAADEVFHRSCIIKTPRNRLRGF